MATRHYALRDSILNELNRAYNHEWVDKDWFFCKYRSKGKCDANMELTTEILALVAYSHIPNDNDLYADESIGDEIRNMIWMNYAGGTTASNVAGRICKHLGVDYDD